MPFWEEGKEPAVITVDELLDPELERQGLEALGEYPREQQMHAAAGMHDMQTMPIKVMRKIREMYGDQIKEVTEEMVKRCSAEVFQELSSRSQPSEEDLYS